MRRGGRLIVCEATGTWGIGLRRALQNVSWRIIETRSARDCFWQLAQHPVSIVAWEGAIERADALVGHLLHQNRFFPRCSAVVLCDRAAARFHSLWREAGAIHVVHSPRELDRMKKLVARHPIPLIARPESLEESIWKELPWNRFGS
jgi:hypothetical protein